MNYKIAAPVPEAITQLQRQLEFRSSRSARTKLRSLYETGNEVLAAPARLD
jgi:hypothetical protein